MFKPLETVYKGHRRTQAGGRTACIVVACRGSSMERLLTPGPSQSVREHSPTGFEWGYPGSGPAQLALALLLDFTQDREWALTHYQAFKNDYVAAWEEPRFSISGAEIVAWLQRQGAAISAGLIPSSTPTRRIRR